MFEAQWCREQTNIYYELFTYLLRFFFPPFLSKLTALYRKLQIAFSTRGEKGMRGYWEGRNRGEKRNRGSPRGHCIGRRQAGKTWDLGSGLSWFSFWVSWVQWRWPGDLGSPSQVWYSRETGGDFLCRWVGLTLPPSCWGSKKKMAIKTF